LNPGKPVEFPVDGLLAAMDVEEPIGTAAEDVTGVPAWLSSGE
jgi:hypothetical protein